MSSYVDSLLSTGETIQFATRQHWITLVRSFVVNGLVVVLALAVVNSLAERSAELGRLPAIVSAVMAVVALWALVKLLMALLRWWVKRYIVTTRRVLEVDGVLSKTVKDSNLDKVNDIVLRQSALGRLLNYGEIEIITGADIGLNRFEWIAEPLRFKRLMLDNKEDFDTLVRAHAAGPADIAQADIPAAIAQLGALRDRGLITPDEFEHKKADLLSRY